MTPAKIVRTLCLFAERPSEEDLFRLQELARPLKDRGFELQTMRLCSPERDAVFKLDEAADSVTHFSLGQVPFAERLDIMERFIQANNVAFNVDLTQEDIGEFHAEILFEIMRRDARKTFNFTYVFNNPPSSPYYPSARFEKDGFSIGLQPTDLSDGCQSLEEWFDALLRTWSEVVEIFAGTEEFLGLDTSIAPLFEGSGSLLNFLKRLGVDFGSAITSDLFVKISTFIRDKAPKPVGLCGLMFPCLEDFELAFEYEQGRFSVERCVFLALHSGLGIDAYPIGVDEDPARVLQILRLLQALSAKHRKPLSARFISDGRSKIGERSDFGNVYLRDVKLRAL